LTEHASHVSKSALQKYVSGPDVRNVEKYQSVKKLTRFENYLILFSLDFFNTEDLTKM
jgi:hypothetical protein